MKERMLVRRILETSEVVVLLPDAKSPDGLEVSIYEGGHDWSQGSLLEMLECTAPATEEETTKILRELALYWGEDPLLDHEVIVKEDLVPDDFLIPYPLPNDNSEEKRT